MTKHFNCGKGGLIRVPKLLIKKIKVLVRQIDSDPQADEAVTWLIEMMRMRGIAPKWPEDKENLKEKQ